MVTAQDIEAQHYEIIDNTIILWAITAQEFYCTKEQFGTILTLIKEDKIDIVIVGGLEVLEKITDNTITVECDIRLSSKIGSNRINLSNSIWDYELIIDFESEIYEELLLVLE